MLSKLNNSRFARLVASLVLTIAAILIVSLTLDGMDQAVYGVALTFIGSLAFQILYDLLDLKLMRRSFFAFVRAMLFWALALASAFMSFMLAAAGDIDPVGSTLVKNTLISAFTIAPSVNALVYTIGAQKHSKHALVLIYPIFSILIAVPMGLICALLIQLDATIFGSLAPAAMVIITLLITLSRQRKRGLIFVKARSEDVSEKAKATPNVSSNTTSNAGSNDKSYDDNDTDYDDNDTDDRIPDFTHSELKDIIESHYLNNSSQPIGSFSLDTDFSISECDPISGIVIHVSESLRYTSSLSRSSDEITKVELDDIKNYYTYTWKNELNSISRSIANDVSQRLPELNKEYRGYENFIEKRISVKIVQSGITNLDSFTVI